ncbi:hypothetical protein MKY24_16620 [Paenibacillus sp. FSL P2-0322]|uniref:hypothetical protein n=1 Tax=Paenibacillus sp. FSL P2-0322 TaxID=2921628 RepID=UPI0030CF2354
MKTFKIRIITKFKTKNELFIPGEVHEARRLSYNFMDFKTPFQIVSGKKSGEEVPFKCAVVALDAPQPTQHQFDAIVKQNGELLADLAVAKEKFSEISDALGEYEGHMIPAIRQLVQDKAELLQTIERHTDEQFNAELLLRRIRELETIVNKRDEMIKSIKSVSVVIRDKRNPVEVPRDVANALDWCQWNGVDNDEIVRHLATGINGPTVNVLRSYVHEGGNGHNLLCALLNGYTTASENNELAGLIDSLTSVWFRDKMGENNRQDLNKVIYEFMRGLDKTAS